MFARSLRSALRSGWTFFTLSVVGFPTVIFSVLLFWYVFAVRNRLEIVRKAQVRIGRSDLVASNHVTLIDHFLIIIVLGGYRLLWKGRSVIVSFIADRKNFFGNWFLRYYMRLAQIIPVDRDPEERSRNGHTDAITATLQTLAKRPAGVYPQGTRVLPGRTIAPNPGIGLIVARALDQSMPIRVIPTWLAPDGMAALQPYAKRWEDKTEPVSFGWKLLRRLFGLRAYWILHHTAGNHLRLVIGEPISTEELRAVAATHRTENRRAIALTRYIWSRVEALGDKQSEEAS